MLSYACSHCSFGISVSAHIAEARLEIVFLFFGFCIVRIDHDCLDLGECGIRCHEAAGAEDKQNGCEQSERDINEQNGVAKQAEQHHTDDGGDIALEAEQSKDQRVLEHLEDGQIERDHHRIDIEAHDKVQKNDEKAQIEAYIGEERNADVVIEEDDVIHKECTEQHIENTENQRLTPVALNGIEEIAHQNDRFLLDDIAHDICRADVDKAEGEDHQSREHQDNIRCRCRNIVDRTVAEDTVECSCDGIQMTRQKNTVEGGVENMRRCKAFGADVAGACKQVENDREVAQQIQKIQLDHFAEVASIEFEEVDQIEILDSVLLLDAFAVEAAGEHFVKIKAFFLGIPIFAEVVAMCHNVFLFKVKYQSVSVISRVQMPEMRSRPAASAVIVMSTAAASGALSVSSQRRVR